MDRPQVLRQFQQLCQAIVDRQIMLLECESLPDGKKAVLVCAIRPINDQLRELIPLARLLDDSFGTLVLPLSPSHANWSPELN